MVNLGLALWEELKKLTRYGARHSTVPFTLGTKVVQQILPPNDRRKSLIVAVSNNQNFQAGILLMQQNPNGIDYTTQPNAFNALAIQAIVLNPCTTGGSFQFYVPPYDGISIINLGSVAITGIVIEGS